MYRHILKQNYSLWSTSVEYMKKVFGTKIVNATHVFILFKKKAQTINFFQRIISVQFRLFYIYNKPYS